MNNKKWLVEDHILRAKQFIDCYKNTSSKDDFFIRRAEMHLKRAEKHLNSIRSVWFEFKGEVHEFDVKGRYITLKSVEGVKIDIDYEDIKYEGDKIYLRAGSVARNLDYSEAIDEI